MRRRTLIVLFVGVVLLITLGSAGYWFYNVSTLYTTDNAKVDGQVVSITSPQPGLLQSLTPKVGERIKVGQVIGKVKTETTDKVTPVDITSPVSGTVVQVTGSMGQQITSDLALLQIANLDTLHIVAYIDKDSISSIHPGQNVEIRLKNLSNIIYHGHVQQIIPITAGALSPSDPPSKNKANQLTPVVISLDNGREGHFIIPGMSAQVSIHLH